MLIELGQSTMANMTAALEHVHKPIPKDKDSYQARKRIGDAMVDSAKTGNRGYVDFQNVGFKVLDEIVHPPGSWQLWFKTIGPSMNRNGGRTMISVLLTVALDLGTGADLESRRQSIAARAANGWSNTFDDPIPLADVVELRALRGLQAGAVSAVPPLRSCDSAVTSCAGANGFDMRTLFGTPSEAQSWPFAVT